MNFKRVRILTYFKLFIAGAFALFLAGCMSLGTVRTMHALSSINPVESDLSGFVFGVSAPSSLKVIPETSKFTLLIQANGDAPVETGFELERIGAADVAFSKLPQDRNRVLSLFKLTDDAKKKVREHQALIRDMKSKGMKGSFGIGLQPDFCKTAPIDYGREKFTAYVAQSGNGELMPLIENMSIKDLLKQAKRSEVRDC